MVTKLTHNASGKWIVLGSSEAAYAVHTLHTRGEMQNWTVATSTVYSYLESLGEGDVQDGAKQLSNSKWQVFLFYFTILPLLAYFLMETGLSPVWMVVISMMFFSSVTSHLTGLITFNPARILLIISAAVASGKVENRMMLSIAYLWSWQIPLIFLRDILSDRYLAAYCILTMFPTLIGLLYCLGTLSPLEKGQLPGRVSSFEELVKRFDRFYSEVNSDNGKTEMEAK